MKAKIKLFVMDVDGTLTDGRIYMGPEGEQWKVFHVKDGYGIHDILHSYGVLTAIVTGRASKMVECRARELEIDYLLQNVKDKRAAVNELASKIPCSYKEIAYIGDDRNDLCAMELCGWKGCPADAEAEVKEICDFVSGKKGGEGAVRDFITWLVG